MYEMLFIIVLCVCILYLLLVWTFSRDGWVQGVGISVQSYCTGHSLGPIDIEDWSICRGGINIQCRSMSFWNGAYRVLEKNLDRFKPLDVLACSVSSYYIQ